jgi:hypothetical protein
VLAVTVCLNPLGLPTVVQVTRKGVLLVLVFDPFLLFGFVACFVFLGKKLVFSVVGYYEDSM